MADEVVTAEETTVTEPIVEVAEKVEEVSTKKQTTPFNTMVDRYKDSKVFAQPGENAEVVYDYSHFEDINDEDYKKADDFLAKHNQKENVELRHKYIMHLNDARKWQRLAEQRFTKLSELEKKVPESQLDATAKAFLEDAKKDPLGAWNKYHKDLGLPEPTYLQKQTTIGDNMTRIKKWQESELVPSIEKKHGIEDDTFVYDSSEAYTPGTPSYEYRKATENKENELQNEYATIEAKQQSQLQTIVAEREAQLTELKNTFYSVSENATEDERKGIEEKFQASLLRLDSMWEEMKSGKLGAESNPFAIKNIYRGVFFDDLVSQIVNEKITDVHKQYQLKGMFLPESTEMPFDVTKIKGLSPIDESKRNTNSFSRLNKMADRYKQ